MYTERMNLPGAQIHRFAGQISHSQRQQDQLIPRDNQLAKGKHKNITNRNKVNMAPSDQSSLTAASPRYPQDTGKARSGFKITSYDVSLKKEKITPLKKYRRT